MKIYMDKELYSIYDRVAKEYIYRAKSDDAESMTVVYSEDGYCIAIHDKDGNMVYAKAKGDH
ncbi:hypothetical protein F4801DRAFT_549287 [Xylaria longipes]|nr:hypothetical protein F4801DRAFT_549287 [Xylaria longipes]